jgi:hypothetical protein
VATTSGGSNTVPIVIGVVVVLAVVIAAVVFAL